MSSTTSKPSLFAAASAVFMAGSLAAATPASAEPTITFTHKPGTDLGGGSALKSVDCGTLHKFYRAPGKKPELYVTCEFAKQVDANNQQACGTKEQPLSSDPTILDQQLSYNSNLAFLHFGVAHGVCIPQSVRISTAIKMRQNKPPAIIASELEIEYPGHKTTDGYCPLAEAAKQCRTALGLD